MTRNIKTKSSKIKDFNWKKFFTVVSALAVFGFAGACGLIWETLRDAEIITKDMLVEQSTQRSEVLSSDGERLYYTPNPTKKEYVSIDRIPINLQNAVVSIEDERFYNHEGVDIKGLLRALVINLVSSSSPGGSTINMQVSKNLLTSTDKSIARKIKDIYYAYEMDDVLTKEDILELYLNSMGLGRGAEGVQAGAKVYFDKNVEDLTLAECAMLAGITKHPNKYSVYKLVKLDNTETKEDVENKLNLYINTEEDDFDDVITDVELKAIDKIYSWELIDDDTYSKLKNGSMVVRKAIVNEEAVNRQRTVLMKMHQLGYISDKQYKEAKAEPINIKIPNSDSSVVSYIEDLVYQEVVELLMNHGYSKSEALDLYYDGGLQIQTSIDKNMQASLEEEFNNRENFPDSKFDSNGIIQPQASMVIADYRNGEIKALLGGREIKGGRVYNRAITPRQTGSTIKPLAVFTPAIDMGRNQSEMVSDIRGGYKFEKNQKWNPGTTTKAKESMTLREGLAKSSNTITVKVAEGLGKTYEEAVEVMVDYLDNFGLTTIVDSPAITNNDLNFSSLTLGGLVKGVSPLEMASAYGVLANKGVYVEPTIVSKISFKNSSIVIQNTSRQHRVVDEDVAYIMTDMLKAVASDIGTGRRARIATGMPVAGKTGTTNGNREAWFIGYTPYYVASTLIADDEGNRGVVAGSSTPASLWSKVMTKIHENLEVVDFETPKNIEFENIDLDNGRVTSDTTGDRVTKAGFIKKDN